MRARRYLIIFAFCLCSCAQTGAIKTGIYKASDMEIYLHKTTGGQTGGHSHPTAFETGDLKYLLGSIKYRQKGLLRWGDATRVFSANELYRMAPHLVDAFAKAGPNDELIFESKAAKQGSFFSSEAFSSGIMFVEKEKLHCIFGNINTRPDPESIYDGDPRREYAGIFVMLAPSNWQTLVTDKRGTHYNWIAIDYKGALEEKKSIDHRTRIERKRRRAIDYKNRRETADWEDWEPGEAIDPAEDYEGIPSGQ